MAKPSSNATGPKNPFVLLRAILVGLALGFIAIMFLPSIVPNRETDGHGPRRTAASDDARIDSFGRPQVPVSEPARDSATAGPVLIPAVNVTFPKPFSEEDMTAVLQPLLTFKISDEDVAAIKEEASFLSKGDMEAARAAIKKIVDPVARVFAEWRRLRAGNADFAEIMAFRKAHPLFPEPPLDAGIEKSLFLSDTPYPDILKFYAHRTPVSGVGKASLGGALIESGERERGLEMVRFVWMRYPLDPVVQEHFTRRFGALLTQSDQERRALMLAARAKQLEGAGKGEEADANGKGLKWAARLRAKWMKRGVQRGHRGKPPKQEGRLGRKRHGALPSDATLKQSAIGGKIGVFGIAPLAVAVQLKKDGAPPDQAGKPVNQNDNPKDGTKPAEAKGKPEAKEIKPQQKTLQTKLAAGAFKLAKERSGGSAILLARLKALRREGADDDVWSLLRSINPDTADLADPDRWWDFRRNEVRRALNEDRPKTAYAIAKSHGPLDEESRSEAEFLAGWIALRFLKDYRLAEAHFEAARAAKGPSRDQARAAYWLGRARLERGAQKDAEAAFEEAAGFFHTFYGFLARQAFHKDVACGFPAPPRPSPAAISLFVNEEAQKALMIAKQLDWQPVATSLALDLARQISDAEQMTLLYELTERTVPRHVTVRAAKIALSRGLPADAYAYPTLLPRFDPAGGNAKVEAALLNALTRQESEFNTASISGAGARGLMQLMPQTAKLVAAANRIKYELPRLISDPSYNVTLGSAFLAQLIAGYDGSYVLALAAYNAGPGRVAQWIKDFGDPRDKSMDPIDWVERIPFAETRHYVQYILESTQLYRCRFESGAAKLRLVEDLHRGRPGKIPELSDLAGSGELDQTP